MPTLALVGNPNCGKTTLFNALTKSRQRVGNWSGVTVECKSGNFVHDTRCYEVVDLPGVYSLSVSSEAAVDEGLACEFILSHKADVLVNIVDGSNLERHLYLTLQLAEMGQPMILAVNMMDVARDKGVHLQLKRLSQDLGCRVVPLQAHKGRGLEDLKAAIAEVITKPRESVAKIVLPYVDPIPEFISSLTEALQSHPCEGREDTGVCKGHEGGLNPKTTLSWLATRLLEDDLFAKSQIPASLLPQVTALQRQIHAATNEDADILFADARYRNIQALTAVCIQTVTAQRVQWSERLDKIFLNRFLSLPLFLTIMYALFFIAINIGGAFQDFFDLASNALFVDGLSHLLSWLKLPDALVILLANGVGKGINTTLTFIPVIGALFFCLSFLEDSGYMARAAFVVDRIMRAFGLPGKAFVPMIVGFGCNVPAVMAARTLENKRDRILTIMMSPFMSCGARLAIYAVFTAAFFPLNGQNIVFALYLIGIAMAFVTGLILRKTLLFGKPAPLVMELPPYHLPRLSTLSLHAWQRLKTFITRAGKLIIPISILIGVLNTLNLDGSFNSGEGSSQSILSALGRFMTPLFAPMGIQQDNWPATVGLVTGILAKEVVVGTLNTLYTQIGHLTQVASTSFHFGASLYAALTTIPANLAQLAHAFSNPLVASAPMQTLNADVYGVMYQHFDGRRGAFAYLLFVLLYFPCVSTTAAMLRELDKRWAIFSIVWMTGVAYGAAVLFYQATTFMRHPLASSLWVLGVTLVFIGVILSIRLSARREVKLELLRASS